MLKKIIEGLAVAIALCLFVATSKERPLEAVPTSIPYQRLIGVDDIGYRCALNDEFDVELYLTNLSAEATQVEVSIFVQSEATDTAVENSELWKTEVIELLSTTSDNRLPMLYSFDFWDATFIDWSSTEVFISSLDEAADIVVEGRTLYDPSANCEILAVGGEQ